jgi:hypothetical protein
MEEFAQFLFCLLPDISAVPIFFLNLLFKMSKHLNFLLFLPQFGLFLNFLFLLGALLYFLNFFELLLMKGFEFL